MDLTNATLVGLVTLGFVNVLSIYKPELDSRAKFAASIAVAFAVLFVPAEIGNLLLDKIKTALEVAFAVSGTYKLAQKIGGDK